MGSALWPAAMGLSEGSWRGYAPVWCPCRGSHQFRPLVRLRFQDYFSSRSRWRTCIVSCAYRQYDISNITDFLLSREQTSPQLGSFRHRWPATPFATRELLRLAAKVTHNPSMWRVKSYFLRSPFFWAAVNRLFIPPSRFFHRFHSTND